MKSVIRPYFEDGNSSGEPKGYQIVYYDDNNNEITIEEYYGSTAEEWLSSNGIGGVRQPTLLYLRQALQAAGKNSLKLNQLEAYLQIILALYAQDPNPRVNWPPIPVTFEEAVKEAVETLQSN